ncbi:hypothetical protein V6N13_065888 [Hibiscus sabdariffa]
MYGHLQENCPETRQTSIVEENVAPHVSNQQQAEESSFGPWMVVERRQRKHVIKQVNSSKSLSNQATKQREFTATPKSTKPISLRKPPVVIFSDFPILTRSQTKPNNSNHPPLDQLKHSTVVVDENLDPNILLIPSSPPSFPMTGLAPPTGEPPDKQVQPTHVLAPHTPIGTNLQSNQIDEISDPSGSTQVAVTSDFTPQPGECCMTTNLILLSLLNHKLVVIKQIMLLLLLASHTHIVLKLHVSFVGYDKLTRLSVYVMTVYTIPSSSGCKLLWPHLKRLAASIRSPWVLYGDFNATVSIDDRKGCIQSPCKAIQHLLFDYGLRDMGYHGPDFTWSHGLVQARLDRFISNSY